MLQACCRPLSSEAHLSCSSSLLQSFSQINSLGCIHAHPEDMKKIIGILKELDVDERPNTLGKLPYPYKQQGLLSVEERVEGTV